MTETRAGLFLSALKEDHKIKKCAECERLQGGLVRIKTDCPEFKEEIDKLTAKEFHKCPGCTSRALRATHGPGIRRAREG